MNDSACTTRFPAALVIATAVFLSALLLGGPLTAGAAAEKPGPSAAEQTEARIRQLQSAIGISSAQEVLWNNVAQVMRDNAKEMDAITRDRTESSKAMNAVEHLKLHIQLTETGLAQQKRFMPPFEALYAGLSDEQKKTTDTLFRTGKHGKKRIK